MKAGASAPGNAVQSATTPCRTPPASPLGTTGRGRIEELDALRGVAALNVLIYHFASVLPLVTAVTYGQAGYFWLNLWKYSPLHVIGAGPESVIFFFVLSGFVLALPYRHRRMGHYGNFLARRVLRLYPTYIMAVGVAVALRLLVAQAAIPWASTWFNANWQAPLDHRTLVKSILFIGDFDTSATVPPAWSLVHEMRISLIFSVLLLAARLVPSSILLCSSIAASFISYYFARTAGAPNNLFLTGVYLSEFVAGILLAKHFESWRAQFRRLSRTGAILSGILALVCYTYPEAIFPSVKLLHLLPVNVLPVTFASAWIIVCGVECAPIASILRNVWFGYFGKVSYSLYLYHMTALLAVVHLWGLAAPPWLLWIAALALTLAASDLSYRFVELPSTALSRHFASRAARAPTARS